MQNFSHQTRVFLFLEPVDMRKSFRGLCLLAESVLKEDPASGHWFAFINRRQDRLKLLGWAGFLDLVQAAGIRRLSETCGASESGTDGDRRYSVVVTHQRD